MTHSHPDSECRPFLSSVTLNSIHHRCCPRELTEGPCAQGADLSMEVDAERAKGLKSERHMCQENGT